MMDTARYPSHPAHVQIQNQQSWPALFTPFTSRAQLPLGNFRLMGVMSTKMGTKRGVRVTYDWLKGGTLLVITKQGKDSIEHFQTTRTVNRKPRCYVHSEGTGHRRPSHMYLPSILENRRVGPAHPTRERCERKGERWCQTSWWDEGHRHQHWAGGVIERHTSDA